LDGTNIQHITCSLSVTLIDYVQKTRFLRFLFIKKTFVFINSI